MIIFISDPIQYAKLKYLGPILGHIHSGGLRFKDNIESAFKRQGLMLSQSIRRLEDIQSRPNANDTLAPRDDVLRALWHRSRELHYVAHFCEPLDVDIGDIGYITGDPPQFTRLDNVTDKIMSEEIYPDQGIQKSRFTPLDRWTTEEVNGIVRWVFRSDLSLAVNNSWDIGMNFGFVTLTPRSLRTGAIKDLVWIKISG